MLADDTLRAPRNGEHPDIELRILGEVLAPGGKVLTMLEVSSVYMIMSSALAEAGRSKISNEVHIVLNA